MPQSDAIVPEAGKRLSHDQTRDAEHFRKCRFRGTAPSLWKLTSDNLVKNRVIDAFAECLLGGHDTRAKCAAVLLLQGLVKQPTIGMSVKTFLTELRHLDSLTALLHQFEIPTHRDGVPAVLITEVEALHLRVPIVRQVADGTQDVLLVRIATDAGHVGYGEVVSSSYIGRAVIEAPMSAPRRHGLAAALVGKDPLDPPARWNDMYEASRWYGRAGVALHVISGPTQRSGTSLARRMESPSPTFGDASETRSGLTRVFCFLRRRRKQAP